MPASINTPGTTAEAMRQLYQPAFDQRLKLTAETDIPSVLEPGQAIEQMDIVESPDLVRDIM